MARFVVDTCVGGSMCIEISTEHEAEEIPGKNWRQGKEAPVLREVDFVETTGQCEVIRWNLLNSSPRPKPSIMMVGNKPYIPPYPKPRATLANHRVATSFTVNTKI